MLLEESAPLEVAAARSFVSRGGEKLEGALDAFGLSVQGAVAADVGASTGGFTDCLLQRGASKVYAVDVGHDQLHPRLREDLRVISREGTNARDAKPSDFDEPLDIVVVDASFISLEKLLPALSGIVRPGGALVALVKPQFEVGAEAARRTRGVVRDPDLRARAIEGAREAIHRAGFHVVAECDSALPGPRGNVEHFVYARRARDS